MLSMHGYTQEKSKTDSLAIEINAFRAEKKIKPLESDLTLLKTLAKIIKIGYDKNNENSDTLRKILASNHIFDYNFRLVNIELSNSNNSSLNELSKRYLQLDTIVLDSAYNQMACIYHNKKISILLSQNFIRFDSLFTAGSSDVWAGDHGTPRRMTYDWLSFKGTSIGKEPIRYNLYNDKTKNIELSNLKKSPIELGSDGHFDLYIDLRLPENKDINTVMFYDSKSNKIAKLKFFYDE